MADVFVTSITNQSIVNGITRFIDVTGITSQSIVNGATRFIDVTGVTSTSLVTDADGRNSKHYDLFPIQSTAIVGGIGETQNQIRTYSIYLFPRVQSPQVIQTYQPTGDFAEIPVGGFIDFKVADVTPGAGFIGASGYGQTPTVAFARAEALNVRAIPSVVVQMDAPVAYHGVPRIPLAHSTSEASLTASFQINDDPPDSLDEQGQFLHRFKVGTLADASSGEYWLESWKDTNDDWEWKSAYPYRPWVQKRTERLKDHTDRVYTRSLHFNNKFVEHMWLNMGAEYEELTVIVAGLFHGYRGKYGHHLLDAGKATPIYEDVVDGESHKINDKLDYRAAMLYKKRRAFFSTAQAKDIRNKKHIKVRHDDGRKPKIVFCVFNGENSMAGSWDIDDFKVKYGSLPTKPLKRLVMGRARNRVNRKFASDMTLFEMLIYTKALDKKQIKKRCKRLAGRYKFQRYWD